MELNRHALLGKLELLMPGIDKKGIAENTSSFIFDGERIYTYNDTIGVAVNFTTGLQCAVPAQSLYRLLSKLPDEAVEVALLEGALKIKGKKSRATVKVVEGAVLPFDDKVTKARDATAMPAKSSFNKAVQFCLFTTNRHTQEQVMGCVHIASDKKGTYAESTDSTRMTRYYFTTEVMPLDILIPLAAAQSIIKYEVESIAEAEGWLVFNCKGDTTFATWTVAATFPNLKKAIASFGEVQSEIVLPPGIIETLERAEIFAQADTKVDQDVYIVFTVNDGKMKISSSGVYGKFTETVDVEYTGAEVSFALPPLFVRDILRIVTSIQVLDGVVRCAKKRFFHYAGIIESGEGE